MLPGAQSCKIAEQKEVSALGGGAVTPGITPVTATIKPPKVPSASNVTIGRASASDVAKGMSVSTDTTVPKGQTTTPRSLGKYPNKQPTFGEKALGAASKGLFHVGSVFGNPNLGSGMIDSIAGNYAEKVMGLTPETVNMAKQYADGQYGKADVDRFTQLQWARQDLQPLQQLVSTEHGKIGLGANMGMRPGEQVDMTNQDFRRKVLNESLKAQKNQQEYTQQTENRGKLYKFLGDHWKTIAGLGGGAMALGFMNHLANKQSQQNSLLQNQNNQLQQIQQNTAFDNPKYQPFAYRTDSEHIL